MTSNEINKPHNGSKLWQTHAFNGQAEHLRLFRSAFNHHCFCQVVYIKVEKCSTSIDSRLLPGEVLVHVSIY